MELESVKFAALCSVLLVALAGFGDFLLGKKGRKKLCDEVIFKSWYSLELMNLNGVIIISAKWLTKFLDLIFGKYFFSLKAVFIQIAFVTILFLLVMKFELYLLLFKAIGLNIDVVEPNFKYKPENPFSSYFSLIGYPFVFASYLLTRYFVEKIAESAEITKSILFWICDFTFAIIIAVICFALTGVLLKWYTPWHKYIYLIDLNVGLSFLGLVYGIISLIPTILHSILFLFSFFLYLLEWFRKFLVLILERIDESQKSPLGIIAVVMTMIGTILLALIRLMN